MSTEAYDPNAPEGEVGARGQYMSKRDLRVTLSAFAVIVLLSFPVYHFLLGYTESSRCIRNMQGISEALALYANLHDERFPPIDRTESLEGLTPAFDDGKVYSWASDISGYMNARSSFQCPTAKPDDLVPNEDPRNAARTLLSSYGMYGAYGSVLTSQVENPDQTLIIAETSNEGAENTFDPVPFTSRSGQKLPDGFTMGWNNGNDGANSKTNTITRLAFPGTKDGKFAKDGDARHGDIIHVLSSSGQLLDIHPSDSKFGSLKRINPFWTLPPNTISGG